MLFRFEVTMRIVRTALIAAIVICLAVSAAFAVAV